ncbi:hypothetical protein EDB92DRAFT_2021332 [Lactarius akahatsu]|uniref:Pentatricopeptide repeat-containing protein n=1 Tax=Lactarius akahatsu TaxID=416441 RepID=A0AAD4LCT4_9AGAM|nr:hypothetical protein EDB92DRAFT_2021332 [Lactarius akahatsu]
MNHLFGRRTRRHVFPLPSRPSPPNELARRVEALAVTAEKEGDLLDSDLTYREEELLELYEDLLALPDDEAKATPARVSTEELDRALVEAIVSRLSPSSSAPSDALSTLLYQRTASDSPLIPVQAQTSSSPTLPHRVALDLLTPISQELTAIRNAHASSANDVPLALLSVEEWQALTRVCLAHDDPRSAKTAVELMMASGMELVEEHANDVIGWYAERGDVLGCEQFMQTFIKGPLTDHQRHLHIKAHEKSVPSGTIPDDALSLLHAYESAGRPAPMTAYSRLIAALFRTSSSRAHAQAWDLFAHMRYVAHPQPDALLYTQMIHACALPTPAEPERALDLFTEMTVDRGIAPTAGAYNAAILACARSGSKVYVNEAFRLAKEMLDAHRDARGRGTFRPNSRTFGALLEGAKRIGDLGRARWILAEMVEAARQNPDVVVDERIMTHVFHAYAAYRPPFRRSMAPLVATDAAVPPTRLEEPIEETVPSSPSSSPVETASPPSFTHLPPQSSAEVLSEAHALFARLSRSSSSRAGAEALPALPDVRVTPRLLNAYLAVWYAHASLETAHEAFRTVFAQEGVEKDAHTLVEALERCARGRGASSSSSIGGLAEEAWREWVVLENSSHVSARHIQRAYAARLRILALTGQLDEALACLRAFVARYPPHSVRATATAQEQWDMRTTRVSLADRGRPLVRLTTPLDVQDERVPPLLAFADVEVLHHRLVAVGDLRGVAYVKWACKAYEGALRRRREAALLKDGCP